jgi:hypothetical protein
LIIHAGGSDPRCSQSEKRPLKAAEASELRKAIAAMKLTTEIGMTCAHKKNTGARWEITVDGIPRSYRDDQRLDIAGAEGIHSLEGNMCGTAMRGAVALPGTGGFQDVLALEIAKQGRAAKGRSEPT